jgi:hypothetical protein
MGVIRKIWTDGKAKLSKDQLAKIPKEDFGKTADNFEADCADAIKKLMAADAALYKVWLSGEEGTTSVRQLLEKYAQEMHKAGFLKDTGTLVIDVDRAKAGQLKKVMMEYGKVKATAAKLGKYAV